MGVSQLYNDKLLKLPNEYGDVSVMFYKGPLMMDDFLHTSSKKVI